MVSVVMFAHSSGAEAADAEETVIDANGGGVALGGYRFALC
jgi:hypothetical protein